MEENKNNFGAKEFFLRALDIFAGVTLFIVLSWFIGILLLVKFFEDFHNPVYVSKRTTVKGKEYKHFKIRTMCIHADETDDPRITYIGKILRKFRLDKLPALLNVIAGHITIFEIFDKN